MDKLEQVKGCKLGLDEHPLSLPEEICYQPCDWKIKSHIHFNCMWVLCSDSAYEGMSLRKIAGMLGITHESVRQILKNAIKKLPSNQFQLDQMLDDNEDKELSKKTCEMDENKVIKLLELLE